MKTLRIIFLFGLVVGGAGRVAAIDKTGLRVDVIFLEPEHFTDVSDGYPQGSVAGRDGTLAELRSYILKTAGRLIPSGQKLTITITDVDLAGDFEPWHGGRLSDVRIVRDIYPPAIKLAFQLKDADGNVIKSGERSLRDLSFQMKLMINDRDPLRHEKALLDDWINAEFREKKAR